MDLYKFYTSPENLDEKFDQLVDRVKSVISQLTNKDLITPMWTRWFEILKNSSIEEKFARNEILNELNKQLNDDKTLGYPFTDDQNCNIDLSTLRQMIMNKRVHEPETIDGDDNQANDSMCVCTSNRTGSMHYCMETDNRRLLEEIEALAIELQEQQLKHEYLKRRIQKKMKVIEALRQEGKYLNEQMAEIKQMLSWSSVTSTKLLNTDKALTVTPQYFVTLFSVFCETDEDMAGLKELDSRFKELLDSHIKNYLGEKRCLVLQNLSKEYDVLKAAVSQRYKKVMRLQMVAQEKELSLLAMRYLALLRMIFMSSYKGSKSTKKAVVQFLLDRSNEISEEL